MIPPHELLTYPGICAAPNPRSQDAATAAVRHLLGRATAQRRVDCSAGLVMIGAALGIAVSG